MSEKKKGNRNIFYLVILSVFFLFFLFNIYIFLLHDISGPDGDDIHHIQYAYDFYNNLKTGGLFTFFFRPPTFYPPFTYTVTSVFFLLFGASMKNAVFSQAIFWLILMISMYCIGTHIGNEETGLLSALLVMTIPMVSIYSVRYYLDIPMISLIALSFYCLLKSDFYNNRGWTISFFILSALGMLTKVQFALYIAIPFFATTSIYIYNTFRETDKKEKIKIICLLVGVPVAVFIGLILLWKMIAYLGVTQKAYMFHCWISWSFAVSTTLAQSQTALKINLVICYFISMIPLIIPLLLSKFIGVKNKQIRNIMIGSTFFFIIIWYFYAMQLKNIIYLAMVLKDGGRNTVNFFGYIKILYESMFFWAILLIIIGVCHYLSSPLKTSRGNFVLFSFLTGLVVFYFFPVKDPRWFLPVIVFAATISCLWISRIKNKLLHHLAVFIFIYFGLLGWLGSSLIDSPFFLPLSGFPRSNVGVGFGRLHILLMPQVQAVKGFGVDDICDAVDKMSDGKECKIVWIYNREGSEMHTLWSLPIYLRYRKNKMFRSRYSNEMTPETESTISFLRKNIGIPTEEQESIFIYPDTRKEDSDYDYLFVIATLPGEDMEKSIGNIQLKTRETGDSRRPDIIQKMGLCPGFDVDEISTIIIRIPLGGSLRDSNIQSKTY